MGDKYTQTCYLYAYALGKNMADCAKLEQQAQQLADQLSRLTEEGNRISILNPTSADVAIELGRSAARILGQINTTKSQLRAVQDQQRDGSCIFTGFFPQRRNADAAAANLNSFIDKADQIARTAKQQEEASRQATTSTNNSGTGVPGTAGTGPGATPDADQLEEIAVTAKRRPEPLEEVQVTGTRRAEDDGLDEVEVTGKRTPESISPGSDPAVDKTAQTTEAEEGTGQRPATGTEAPYSENTNRGLSGSTQNTRSQASRQDAANYALLGDWRVRLALAPGAKYLYDLPDGQTAGILAPLRATDGVIFPYTPTINVSYNANYEPTEVTHSNYKIFQYRSSSVDNVTITCDFTAQDTHEANYLLAVIHFFRTVTKMFYGKDQDPKAGTPPPLCYLYGLGQFQFNAHPLLITNFTYSLPDNVDYIRASTNTTTVPGVNKSSGNTPNDTNNVSNQRLSQSPSSVAAGGVPNKPTYTTTSGGTVEPTYVPTKITITVQAVPVVARNDISQSFSVKEYATGKLLQGSKRPGRGGIW